MTRIAIISDVHGNFPALEAVLADISREGAERIYCLGDSVGYFCMVNEVLCTLRERHIPSILGNHDDALAFRDGQITRSRTATAILQRQLQLIADDNLEYLRRLPVTIEFEADGRRYWCVHGGLESAMDEYITSISEEYFTRHRFAHDVLLAGQTHVPMITSVGRYVHCNPGAVGQPRDGDKRASYLLIDGQQLHIRRVSYDARVLISEMERLGFPSSLCAFLP